MGYVDYEQEGHVGIVTINRPKALNALNEEVLKDLETVFDAIDQETVRAVILTGAGEKSFVAGADIAAMSTMTKEEVAAHMVNLAWNGLRGMEPDPVLRNQGDTA